MLVASSIVRVETIELNSAGTRQIAAKRRATDLLEDRRDDLETALREACRVVQDSATQLAKRDGWHVKRLEAKFGLTLAAEAGVIVSRASAEACLEVTVTIERS